MSDEPVDLEILRSFVGGDPREVSASLELFVESAHRARKEIRRAEGAGDAVLVGAVAHRFKSTALYLGAAALAACCARIERAGATQDIAAIRAETPTLESEIDRVLAALAPLLSGPSAQTELAR
jgi:HPt (histidine-containing phosphotransfer) domain-containing protein